MKCFFLLYLLAILLQCQTPQSPKMNGTAGANTNKPSTTQPALPAPEVIETAQAEPDIVNAENATPISTNNLQVKAPKMAQKWKTKTNDKIIDVSKFGASGLDKGDDTEALKKILAQLQPNQKLYFPKGTYLISEALILEKNNIEMYGDGEASVLQFTNTTDLYKKYNDRAGFFNVAADNIHIHDLAFDQNFRNSGRKNGEDAKASSLQGGTAFLKKRNINYLIVENCLFYDFYGDALGVFKATADEVIIRKNKFVSTFIVQKWKQHLTKGEQSIGFATLKHGLIEYNNIQGALDDAIAIHNASSDVIIQHNVITTTAGRIIAVGAERVTIAFNKITVIDDAPSAIYLTLPLQAQNPFYCKDITIENNEIIVLDNVNCAYAIRCVAVLGNIKIMNNNITFGSKPGIGIAIHDKKVQKTNTFMNGKGLLIAGNAVKNASIGIHELTAKRPYENVTIENNTFTDTPIALNFKSNWTEKNNKFVRVKKQKSTEVIRVANVKAKEIED